MIHFLHASERQISKIQQAVCDHDIEGVQLSPAFLGRVVVQCADDETAERLKSMISDLN